MRTAHLLTLPILATLAACGSTTDAASGQQDGAPATETPATETPATETPATETPATETTSSPTAAPAATEAASGIYALDATALGGEAMPLAALQGKVTVFVNVASKCGYTGQYAGLQKLQEELGGDDFTVVGIPSNDFGRQEPGSAAEIQAFCQENYGVTFPMLAKTGTKEGDSPIFDGLAGMTGERPGWNFCKFVVSKDGSQARFFKSNVGPDSQELRGAIAEYRAL